MTEASKSKHWIDGKYTEDEIGRVNKWLSDRKKEALLTSRKKGMDSYIKELFPDIIDRVEYKLIHNMKNENEIWEVFDTMYNSIDNNDELVFDITHSFRSIPMLAVTVINYAKVLKKCELCRVYYGAYEASQEEAGSNGKIKKVAPVIDLTVFNEILDWSYAADAFVSYGNADKMREAYEKRMDRVNNYEKRYWSPLKSIITDMENVSLCIATCRGADASKLSGNQGKHMKSVKASYQKLKQDRKEKQSTTGNEITPMIKLLAYVSDNLDKYFDCEKDYEIGLAIVKWCIEKNMIQQGYTALEETIKTYICEQYGLDDISRDNREEIISNIINGERNGDFKDRDILFEKLTQNNGLVSKAYNNCDEDKRLIIKSIIYGLPSELWKLSQTVKEYRNDINHMGFNKKALDANKLSDRLKELFSTFQSIVGETENKENDKD